MFEILFRKTLTDLHLLTRAGPASFLIGERLHGFTAVDTLDILRVMGLLGMS